MLQDMFGEDSVPKMFKGEKLYVAVNNSRADIDLVSLVSKHLFFVSNNIVQLILLTTEKQYHVIIHSLCFDLQNNFSILVHI